MFFSSIVFLRDCDELSCSTYKGSCLNGSVAEKLNEFYSRSKMLFLTVEAKMSRIVPLTSAPGVTTIWEAFAQADNNNLARWGYTPIIVGMPDSDDRVGIPGQDIVVTLGGDDSVRAQGVDDSICRGPGNDNLRGGDSDDTVGGYSGDDNIFGGAGYHLLTSNDGDEKLWAAMIMTTYMMVQISTMVMEDPTSILQ
jgi:Ca2+-binding RTX toxin-like protein